MRLGDGFSRLDWIGLRLFGSFACGIFQRSPLTTACSSRSLNGLVRVSILVESEAARCQQQRNKYRHLTDSADGEMEAQSGTTTWEASLGLVAEQGGRRWVCQCMVWVLELKMQPWEPLLLGATRCCSTGLGEMRLSL